MRPLGAGRPLKTGILRGLGAQKLYRPTVLIGLSWFFMVALCNRADHYIFMLWFVLLLSFFFPSPNLSRRRLDVYHTSTHGVALVGFRMHV